jgi:hypothetical protein
MRRTLLVSTALSTILMAPLRAQDSVDRSPRCEVLVTGGGSTTSYVDGVPVGPSPDAGPNMSVHGDTISILGVVDVANSASRLSGSCGVNGHEVSLILQQVSRNVDWVAHATHPESYRAVYPGVDPGEYRVSMKWRLSPDSLVPIRDATVRVREQR